MELSLLSIQFSVFCFKAAATYSSVTSAYQSIVMLCLLSANCSSLCLPPSVLTGDDCRDHVRLYGINSAICTQAHKHTKHAGPRMSPLTDVATELLSQLSITVITAFVEIACHRHVTRACSFRVKLDPGRCLPLPDPRNYRPRNLAERERER